MNPRDLIILIQATKAHEIASKRGVARLWETTYAHDRRKHRHKCQCCGKIVNTGEQVVMYRFGATKTRVVHTAEADNKIFQGAGYTFRELALTHAYSHAIVN